ncbi:UNVERIFIED_CONTAM: hypothetical protein Slati_0195700 [Sesamum latifolium]|uniref:Uncharacterized protein n=1 Tax=Sesamum latifolium TaxID=2727402 RepID=A0AAW2YBI2_9LAMI
MGSNPSFTWRSIQPARPLLMGGIRWSVGDGSQINVASDPWLPRPPTFKLIASPVSLPPSATVSDLLWDDRSWNEGLIQAEFTSIDAECILQISTSPAPTLDSLHWHFGARGAFSVRSAYSLALRGRRKLGRVL